MKYLLAYLEPRTVLSTDSALKTTCFYSYSYHYRHHLYYPLKGGDPDPVFQTAETPLHFPTSFSAISTEYSSLFKSIIEIKFRAL